MSGQCSASQAVHLRLGLAASTFSFARVRYLPHSMARSKALPSAFMIALYAVMICPTNERALSVGIAFLSGANGPRPGGGLHDEKQQRRLRLFTGRSTKPRRYPRLHIFQPIAHAVSDFQK